jgi:hypothetical protein
MNEAAVHVQEVLDFGEVLWGIVLIAVSMLIHAVGMPATLTVADRLWGRWPSGGGRFSFSGVAVLVAGSWMIVLVHLVEVAVWAQFLLWRGALASTPDAFYYALCQYATVGSDLSLPTRWRLTGGMIAMAGLLTFAWSTAILLQLAEQFEAARRRRAGSPRAADPRSARGGSGTG